MNLKTYLKLYIHRDISIDPQKPQGYHPSETDSERLSSAEIPGVPPCLTEGWFLRHVTELNA